MRTMNTFPNPRVWPYCIFISVPKRRPCYEHLSSQICTERCIGTHNTTEDKDEGDNLDPSFKSIIRVASVTCVGSWQQEPDTLVRRLTVKFTYLKMRVTGEHFNYKNSITRQNLHDSCVGSQGVKGLAFRLEIQGETLCSRVLQAEDEWRAWDYLFRTCLQGLLVNLHHRAEFQSKPPIRRPWVAP